jgi:hypothetical protein
MKEFLNKYKNFSESFNPDDIDYLGFSPIVNDSTKYELLKQGWWHLFFFASGHYTNYALRITPNSLYNGWNIMEMHRTTNTNIIAPELSSLWYLSQMELLLDPDYFNEYGSILPYLEEISEPFLKLVNGQKYLDSFKQIILSKNVTPDSEANKDKLYIQLWNFFDNSYGHKILRQIIEKYSKNLEVNIKDIAFTGLGHWKTRILYIIAQQSYAQHKDLIEDSELENVYWELFSEANIYDVEFLTPRQVSDNSSEAKYNIGRFAEKLILEIEKCSSYIKESPLFSALVKLGLNVDNYFGVDHVEAAAIFDSEHNNPIMSWNCLVNAAYWSGLNTGETLLPAWEAAIYLAEKHTWTDAHYALKTQYEWYLDYKKKNKIS